MRILLVVIALIGSTGVSSAARFRYSRPLEAPRGWSRVELPSDVLAACRPELPDLRIVRTDGSEIPFAISRGVTGRTTFHEVIARESAPGIETTAIVDRGANPGLVDTAVVEVLDSEFLKPLLIESSTDRLAWFTVARASIFSSGKIRKNSIRFAPTDRRFLRVRIDDRNSDPVTTGRIRLSSGDGDGRDATVVVERRVELPLGASRSEGSRTIFKLDLPGRNLSVSAVDLKIGDPIFSRVVRVYERILFRGVISRRLIAEETLFRAPGGEEHLTISMGDSVASTLELEITNGSSPPLTILGATVVVRPVSLLFFAPGERLELRYGNSRVERPDYDVASALERSYPGSARMAALGPATDSGKGDDVFDPASPGPTVDAGEWRRKQEIVVPATGNVAFLYVARPGRSPHELRIIDSQDRQIPFLLDAHARQTRTSLTVTPVSEGRVSVIDFGGLDPRQVVRAIEVRLGGAEYFERQVSVSEGARDRRSRGRRFLGAVLASRRQGAGETPVSIAIERPGSTTIRLEISNTDNAPLRVQSAVAVVDEARLDFVFPPGEQLFLLAENPRAGAAQYDLRLVAERLLMTRAEEARLGELRKPSELRVVPRWFWAALTVAGLLLLVVLARTMRTDATP